MTKTVTLSVPVPDVKKIWKKFVKSLKSIAMVLVLPLMWVDSLAKAIKKNVYKRKQVNPVKVRNRIMKILEKRTAKTIVPVYITNAKYSPDRNVLTLRRLFSQDKKLKKLYFYNNEAFNKYEEMFFEQIELSEDPKISCIQDKGNFAEKVKFVNPDNNNIRVVRVERILKEQKEEEVAEVV